MTLAEKFTRLKTSVGGNREKMHFEDTFGMPKVSSKCIFSRLPPTEVLSRVNFSASVITCILLFFMTTDSILLFYGYPDGGCEISVARQCLILFVQETVYDLLPVFFGQRCEKCRISCDTHNQIRISFRVFVCF